MLAGECRDQDLGRATPEQAPGRTPERRRETRTNAVLLRMLGSISRRWACSTSCSPSPGAARGALLHARIGPADPLDERFEIVDIRECVAQPAFGAHGLEQVRARMEIGVQVERAEGVEAGEQNRRHGPVVERFPGELLERGELEQELARVTAGRPDDAPFVPAIDAGEVPEPRHCHELDPAHHARIAEAERAAPRPWAWPLSARWPVLRTPPRRHATWASPTRRQAVRPPASAATNGTLPARGVSASRHRSRPSASMSTTGRSSGTVSPCEEEAARHVAQHAAASPPARRSTRALGPLLGDEERRELGARSGRAESRSPAAEEEVPDHVRDTAIAPDGWPFRRPKEYSPASPRLPTRPNSLTWIWAPVAVSLIMMFPKSSGVTSQPGALTVYVNSLTGTSRVRTSATFTSGGGGSGSSTRTEKEHRADAEGVTHSGTDGAVVPSCARRRAACGHTRAGSGHRVAEQSPADLICSSVS